MNDPAIVFFPDPSAFREWLDAHHETMDEQWVGYYKKATGIPSITWPESVEVALCYGWIDGLRKTIDEQRYRIRFTPRRPNSHWSDVNIKLVAKLKKKGLMQEAGLKIYDKRKAHSSAYSYERAATEFSATYGERLRSDAKAWEYFNAMAPSQKKGSVHWVMSAKKEETRLRRLGVLIDASRKGEKIPPLGGGRK